MSITVSSLFRDTGNFFRHQLMVIISISFLVSFITVIIGRSISPDTEQLASLLNNINSASLIKVIQNITPEQQQVLLHAAVAGTITSLLGNTLLLGAITCLIQLVSARQRINTLNTICFSVLLLPRLLLLNFLITMLIQFGFMLLAVPGVILGILFSLAPIVLSVEKTSIISAVRTSFRLSSENTKVIAPAVVLWLLTKLLLLFLAPSFSVLPTNIALILLNTLNNLILIILVIYLFRLYILVR